MSKAFSPLSSTFFQPAAQLLRGSFPVSRNDQSPAMDGRNPGGLGHRGVEGQTQTLHLTDMSRSASPLTRVRSAAQSEDESEYEHEHEDALLSKPLVRHSVNADRRSRSLFQKGGLGYFLFATTTGYQIYIGLLVFWVGGCQFGLLLMNRFILLTGLYKFSYPLTMTFLQLLITHVLVLGFASLTRGLSTLFQFLGIGAVVSPSTAYSPGNRSARYRGGQTHRSMARNIGYWLTHGSGGIAGGGLFEFQTKTAKHVLPVAVIFVMKVMLSNLSYAYAVLPMYMLARIAIIPLSLLFTTIFLRATHSVPTLSSTLIAVLNLLMATIQPGRVTWESIVAGVFSSLFVSLFPVVLLRTYRQLVNELVPQGDALVSSGDDDHPTYLGTKEETRAYWRMLHYLSLLSMALLLPIVLVSGELQQIRRNCYFMDVPWFWFLMLCGGLGSWAVFSSILLLIKNTSPLSATFVSIPRGAFQLMVLDRFRMPVHSWVGVSLCWASCLWYLFVRRRENWYRARQHLQGTT